MISAHLLFIIDKISFRFFCGKFKKLFASFLFLQKTPILKELWVSIWSSIFLILWLAFNSSYLMVFLLDSEMQKSLILQF